MPTIAELYSSTHVTCFPVGVGAEQIGIARVPPPARKYSATSYRPKRRISVSCTTEKYTGAVSPWTTGKRRCFESAPTCVANHGDPQPSNHLGDVLEDALDLEDLVEVRLHPVPPVDHLVAVARDLESLAGLGEANHGNVRKPHLWCSTQIEGLVRKQSSGKGEGGNSSTRQRRRHSRLCGVEGVIR